MEKESKFFLMVQNIQVNSLMDNLVVMEFLNGAMGQFMKDTGKIIKSLEKEQEHLRMGRQLLAFLLTKKLYLGRE